jgi:hypothetical protein
MHGGAPAHFSCALKNVLNIYYDWWISRGGPTAWSSHSSYLNPLDSYLWKCLNILCMQFPSTIKRHFTTTLWMPVRLTITTPTSFNKYSGPWWNMSKHTLTFAVGILSTYYICNLPVQHFLLFWNKQILSRLSLHLSVTSWTHLSMWAQEGTHVFTHSLPFPLTYSLAYKSLQY